ncbi:MAG: GAF domain-containing protein [Burkholderiales bacterium]|jgi:adenylate cyclase|nr:GAF domain-containing protein [Burkholderiales bacterium]
MWLTLDAIRECFEGAIPSLVATCAPDGTPNVTYVSQIHYVDAAHVALTYQFFSKTRENILANPHATADVIHPLTAAQYRLALEYLRTETEGPLFESMKAKLAGIASHTGMAGVFRLLGSDVYRVHAIEHVPGKALPAPQPKRNLLAALRTASDRLTRCGDFASLLEAALESLDALLGIDHAMILMLDARRGSLYTVASRGYPASGIGSEIPLGVGVVGMAAKEGTPIRISYATAEYAYGRAVRDAAEKLGMANMLETEIPLPGLATSRSQLAVPIVTCDHATGVLYVESPEDRRFRYEDEDALVAIAALVGATIHALQADEREEDAPQAANAPAPVAGPPVVVRRYAANDSVFLGDDYLIKGVAGAIFWKLLRDYANEGRTEFTNRELRLDPSLRLPDIHDNLEARLVLLARRLEERCGVMRIEKVARGRFRLCVSRPVQLVEVAG